MPSTQTSSPHEHYDEELVTEVIEETRTEDTQEDETSTDIQTPPTQKTPWFKTRLFLIIVVAAVVVTLFIFAVVLFGFVSKPTPVVKKPVVHRNTTNVPLQLIDDYTQDILGFGARVPGSVGSKKTKDFIAETLGENWRVEYDSFQAETPTLGSLNFSNIIATYQSPSSKRQQEPTRKRLIISAHYDSKYFAPDASGKIFVGATDSAVPCAMMLHLAEAYENMVANSTTAPHYDLQLVFFDGEEAVSYWSSTDSLYGAKHLANLWETQNKITNIQMLMLLDLIGTETTQFPNYRIHFSSDTQRQYTMLYQHEQTLRKANQLRSQNPIFTNVASDSYIEDDHVPFLNRKVPILHLISSPFPWCWHKYTDDYDALDFDTITDLQQILLAFLNEYMFA